MMVVVVCPGIDPISKNATAAPVAVAAVEAEVAKAVDHRRISAVKCARYSQVRCVSPCVAAPLEMPLIGPAIDDRPAAACTTCSQQAASSTQCMHPHCITCILIAA